MIARVVFDLDELRDGLKIFESEDEATVEKLWLPARSGTVWSILKTFSAPR